MASPIVGWYGPLIDLSKANLYIGDFVQLLVFVHNPNPIQYKSRQQGDIPRRRDILVGDDTRPFFPLSVWPSHLGSSIPGFGDLILLQNVKITKYGDVLDGKTVHCSSLLTLIHHSHNSIHSKGSDKLVAECRVGIAAKEKLRKVIEWLKRSGPAFYNVPLHSPPVARNWKLPEESKLKDCFSLSEVLHLTESCKAVFYASVGEMFLPLGESEKDRVFLSRRVYESGESSLVTDLICTGCQLCGSPLNLEQKYMLEMGDEAPLHCLESSNRLHVVSFIYMPFMLYVWDESKYMPVLVRNKAAEILFGNIKAEQVYSSFKGQQNKRNADMKHPSKEQVYPNVSAHSASCSVEGSDTSLGLERKQTLVNNIDFYLVWRILLKALLRQGRNSPLKFEVNVNASLDKENGRFQMVSVQLPCFKELH